MSTEWTEDTVLPYMFKDMEFSDDLDEPWYCGRLIGYDCGEKSPFYSQLASFKYMRPIPEKKTRLMRPAELAGKWLKFPSGWYFVYGYSDKVWYADDRCEVEALRDSTDCIGWADHPEAEFHEGFEVEDEKS